jgi:hypothetical protein
MFTYLICITHNVFYSGTNNFKLRHVVCLRVVFYNIGRPPRVKFSAQRNNSISHQTRFALNADQKQGCQIFLYSIYQSEGKYT